jgi:hypothetical protein
MGHYKSNVRDLERGVLLDFCATRRKIPQNLGVSGHFAFPYLRYGPARARTRYTSGV